jgi:hypothetical protein
MSFKKINIETIMDYYYISRNGIIKNIEKDYILSQKLQNGYYVVHLRCKDGNIKDYSVSRLLGLTYLEIPDNFKTELYVINHKNGDKKDNKVDNLEWTTQKENVKHSLVNKLTTLHIVKVNQYDSENNFIASFNSIKEAAEKTGCNQSAITKCCKGKQKTSKNFIWKYDNNTEEDIDEIDDNPEINSKIIVNYPNYRIYDNGKVYSEVGNKFLKPLINANEMAYVTLCNDNGKRNIYIHNLVAEYFLNNQDNKMIVHKNGNKSDNRVDNLEIKNIKILHKKSSSTN